MATELWGDKYEVIVATHVDKASHIHNHFVINTVSFVDGRKFHRTKKDYLQMREKSDALCKEYGLSVIENPMRNELALAGKDTEFVDDTLIEVMDAPTKREKRKLKKERER